MIISTYIIVVTIFSIGATLAGPCKHQIPKHHIVFQATSPETRKLHYSRQKVGSVEDKYTIIVLPCISSAHLYGSKLSCLTPTTCSLPAIPRCDVFLLISSCYLL